MNWKNVKIASMCSIGDRWDFLSTNAEDTLDVIFLAMMLISLLQLSMWSAFIPYADVTAWLNVAVYMMCDTTKSDKLDPIPLVTVSTINVNVN
jgi:hypothetical protein